MTFEIHETAVGTYVELKGDLAPPVLVEAVPASIDNVTGDLGLQGPENDVFMVRVVEAQSAASAS